MSKLEQQIQFNWGYHDGAADQRNGRRRREMGTHLFALPKVEQLYRAGYEAGYMAAAEGIYEVNSGEVWGEFEDARRHAAAQRKAQRESMPQRVQRY